MANSECEKILNLIPLYIDNELCGTEKDIVSRHLDLCPDCKKELEFLLSLKSTAADLEEIDPSADFHKKLMEKANDIKLKKRTKRIRIIKRSTSGVAAAAVIALSVVGISNLNNTETKKSPLAVLPQPTKDMVISADIPEKKTDENNVPAVSAKDDSTEKPVKNADATSVATPVAAPAAKEEAKQEIQTEKPSSGGGSSALNDNSYSSGGSSGGGSSATPAPSVVADADAESTAICDQQSPCTTAEILLNDENRRIIMDILSHYEKDDIGYIVPDINSVLRKIAQTGIEVKSETSGEYTQNYIIIK